MGKPKLYALLVGINEYKAEFISNLAACVPDVERMGQLLTKRFKPENCEIQTLTNAQATKEEIIKGFEEHLCKATETDFALFYYSGHGGTERTPDEFRPYNPSSQIETIICYDSRTDNNWDLADKEMAKLLAKVNEKKPNIIVIMDCCHSGSGTRGAEDRQFKTRRVDMRKDKRPIETFYGYSDTNNFEPPISDHILLSACQNDELAREAWLASGFCGIFTHCLTTVLEEKPHINYVDLFLEAASVLEKEKLAQNPQYQTVGTVDPFNGFLSTQRTDSSSILPLHKDSRGWYFNKGFLNLKHFDFKQAGHGLKVGIYEATDEVIDDNLLKVTSSWKIKSQKTYIRFPRSLNQAGKYKAAILSFPALGFPVEVADLEHDLLKILQGVLAKSELNIKFTTLEEGSAYKLNLDGESYELIHKPTNVLIQGAKGKHSDTAATHIQKQLTKITNWHWLASFQHPDYEASWLPGSFKTEEEKATFNPDAIDFKLQINGSTLEPSDEVQNVPLTSGDTISFESTVHNNAGQNVHITHLLLAEDYGVEKETRQFEYDYSMIFKKGQLKKNPVWPDGSLFHFKIIVSQEPFPEIIKAQKGIKIGDTFNARNRLGALRSSGSDESALDWFSKTISIKLI